MIYAIIEQCELLVSAARTGRVAAKKVTLKIRLEDQDRRGKPPKGESGNDYAVIAKNAAHGPLGAARMPR